MISRSALAAYSFIAVLAICTFVSARPAHAQVNCSGVAAWSGNSVAYAVGTLVTYSGDEYKCTQAHTSEAGWDPPAVPALWSLVGTCSTATCSASPSAPTGLAASGTTSSATTLSWSAVTAPTNCSISGYTVYKSGTSIGTSSSTSYSVTGLSASTTYTFTVAATDSYGTSPQSSAVTVTTPAAPSCTTSPSAPSGLSASGTTTTGTTLGWTAVTPPTNCSISSYTVYKSGTSIGTASGTSFSVTGLSASTTYTFTVAAIDSHGTGSQSSALTVTTPAASCTAVPSAPTGLSESGTTSTSTLLSWSAVTPPANCSISSYTVYQNGSSISTTASTTFSATGLSPATTYTFAVAATDSDGTSAKSASVTVTTVAASCSASPGAPSGLSASGTSSSATTLSWNAVTPPSNCSITSYGVYKSGSSIGTTSSTSFAVTGLAASTTYTFTVAATDSFGTGSQTSGLAVTTSASSSCGTLAPAPTGLQAASDTYMGTTLTWTDDSNPSGCTVTGYNVYQNGSLIATGAQTPYFVSGLSPTTTYTFTVAAVDGAGVGPQTAAVTATTEAEGISGNGSHIAAGYWDNWGGGEPYIPLNQVDPGYDIVIIAFAVGPGGPNSSGPDVAFSPVVETESELISDVQWLHSHGKKVLLSIGGATGNIILGSTSDANSFANDVTTILDTYGFDGIDLDIENGNITISSGDDSLANPTSPDLVAWESALGTLHSRFPNMMLTWAPETYYCQLGYTYWGGIDGCQLPLINYTRNWLSYVWPQDYDSGAVEALDGNLYQMGGPDFHVAMTEMMLRGFPCADNAGTFAGLAQKQVAFGVPANVNAANGYIADSEVQQALTYLATGTSDGGSYKLIGGPYPSIAGLMTWSLSWDYYNNYTWIKDMRAYLNSLP